MAPPLVARSPPTYWLTRFVLLRLLGAVYAVAFLVAANQIVPLLGEHGLTPMNLEMEGVKNSIGAVKGFIGWPSLFWFGHSDTLLQGVAWAGFALSCIVVAGYANAILLTLLWLLYMSYVHLGGLWYGYGWEIQLLETGFLGIFLCPLWDARPFPRRAPPVAILWLYRWLIFRIMLGAGLIKIRGDTAWRDLTALYYHFETQPIPNALSRTFHFLPKVLLRAGTGFNHLAELGAPWLVFWPRIVRHCAGVIIILFQITLIFSGNLSFLNWLTIVPALACFDDCFWRRILPGVLVRRAEAAAARAEPSPAMQKISWAVAGLIVLLSLPVVNNLVSPKQAMNTSFDSLDLVNTYGAFGTVGRERLNLIVEGSDALTIDDKTVWKPYPYKGLPVDVMKGPPQIAPYHLRLDWQMWFAAMGNFRQYPFTFNLVWKLLHNDPATLSLFAGNPFPEKPPRFIRLELYKYHFAPPGNPEGRYWIREDLGDWLPPVTADNPTLQFQLIEEKLLPPLPKDLPPGQY